MNYRHAYHAGNFADVFKHALLTRMLVYLTRKPQPLRFMDTHAGIGRYDLAADEATRTGEWREGIGRILSANPPAPVAQLLAPYLATIGAADADGRPAHYPGSPAIAAALLRDDDRIALNELHPHDFLELRKHMGRDRRVRLSSKDGYAALKAWIPPVERRGLVLIDPPFEQRDEFERAARALIAAWRKWKTGCYAFWYPIKDAMECDRFYDTIVAGGIERIVKIELVIASVGVESPLRASGLCVINPPFALPDESRLILDWFACALSKGAQPNWRVEWIVSEH